MWAEFERLFSQLSGLFVRIYDSEGKPLVSPQSEPPLCAFLSRYRKSRQACLQDCKRQVKSLVEVKGIVSNRCYGGLSYRIVPVCFRPGERVYILVGKILSEISGGEEAALFARRYRLEQKELERNLARMRFMSEAELDQVSRFIRRFARYLVALQRWGGDKATHLPLLHEVLDFSKRLLAFDGAEPELLRQALSSLTTFLQVSGIAILGGNDAEALPGLPAAYGITEEDLNRLASQDWQQLAGLSAGQSAATSGGDVMEQTGPSPLPGPMTVRVLAAGGETQGVLLLLGGEKEVAQNPLLDFAARMLTSKLQAISVSIRKEREESELALLERLGREIFTAPSVEAILPRALETAMETVEARRGSILLAEGEQKRVTASALRGSHASLSGSISRITPSSVTDRVFSEVRPIIVSDAGSELPSREKRRFPYRSRSYVSVPLKENGHALGVLHLTEKEYAGRFTKWDLALLEKLSMQTSVAIQKAQLKNEVEVLQVQALTDSLTGVFNRRHLDDTLPREIQRATRFKYDLALGLIDVDDFKIYNDLLGHTAGDRILKELAGCISDSIRSVDSVFRYGGDEFVIILPETGINGALRIAEKIRVRVEGSHLGDEDRIADRKLTVCIGVAVFPDMALSPMDLLERADYAQRQAKKLGKNRALVWDSR